MSPEAAWGLVHFVQALNDPTGTQFAGWSPLLVARGPEPKLRRSLGDLHHQLGNCELKKVLEPGATEGQAALRCQRGIVKVRWTVADVPPHELVAVGVHDKFALRSW
jgi:hypothetical protein